MSDVIFRCPICEKPLFCVEKSLKCEEGHSFDRAKSGYIHLLPSNRRHSRQPGDNPEMVKARRRFLSGGAYAHLCETLCQAVQHLPEQGILLDSGCGEGYYTVSMRKSLQAAGKNPAVYGVDISKTAADYAQRADKESFYAVGSVFHLPVQDASCDVVTSVFAPYCGEEFLRVLRPGGYFIMAIPTERHLWELKQAVYETPYENEVKEYSLEGFTFLECIRTERRILLNSKQEILDLFSMTPYAYRTKPEEQKRLESLTSLETMASFAVLIYQKPTETLCIRRNSNGI